MAGAGACHAPRTDEAGVGERGGHAVIFETAGGIHPFILQPKLARPHADVIPEANGILKKSLAFTNGTDHGIGGKGEKVSESPYTGKIERESPILPSVLKLAEGFGYCRIGPVVINIEQIAALRTSCEGLAHIECSPAAWIDTLLVSDRFHLIHFTAIGAESPSWMFHEPE